MSDERNLDKPYFHSMVSNNQCDTRWVVMALLVHTTMVTVDTVGIHVHGVGIGVSV